MIAKVVFEDDGDSVKISTEGAMADIGTVAQNATMAVFEMFTREYRVKNESHKQAQTTHRGTKTGHSTSQDG